jgi:hypothetical protein
MHIAGADGATSDSTMMDVKASIFDSALLAAIGSTDASALQSVSSNIIGGYVTFKETQPWNNKRTIEVAAWQPLFASPSSLITAAANPMPMPAAAPKGEEEPAKQPKAEDEPVKKRQRSKATPQSA